MKGNELEAVERLNDRGWAALEIVAELQFFLNEGSPLDGFYQTVSDILTKEKFNIQEIVPGVLAQMKKTKLDSGTAMIDNQVALIGLRIASKMGKRPFNKLVKQVRQE